MRFCQSLIQLFNIENKNTTNCQHNRLKIQYEHKKDYIVTDSGKFIICKKFWIALADVNRTNKTKGLSIV